jgi:uncharacterized protein (DUF885 family)
MKPFFLLNFFLALLCTMSANAQTDYERACEKLAADKRPDAQRLHELFKLNWDYAMHENPEWATEVGYPGLNDRWSDSSLEAIERRKREARAPLKVIASIDRVKLSEADKLNFDLFKRNTEEAVEGTRFKGEYLAISQLGGIHQGAAQIFEIAPRAKIKDFEDMIARLNLLPKVVDETIVLLRKGLETGITQPRITLREVPQQVKNQLEEDPEKNSLLIGFQGFPPEISKNERERLKNQAAKALKESVLPAFRKLHAFLVKDYLPDSRETIGLSELPDGKTWYEHNARVSTTTKLSPKQIHELGLSEVKRIRGEMDKVIKEIDFKGSFGDFLEHLRKDPKFYYNTTNELLMGYRDICKRADPELAKLFGKLPRLPYGVVAIPSYAEKSQTTAYYMPGSPKTGRPGYFNANTYALNTRPKWEMEALALHEAVPGHHLQIALAQEMEAMPEFRKYGHYTAFVEGWGLYSESLGYEMGFYKDPYSKFGQLTYEMWRAIRLVVDTGMHSLGWTRQQAIDFFMENASKNEHDIVVEVDRYIVWPGQALAYKIGQLKFRELRKYATAQLGEKLDVRAFHDQALGNGALPMDVLEKRIKEWVAQSKAP